MGRTKRTAAALIVGALTMTGVACGGGGERSLDEVAADVKGRLEAAGVRICTESQRGTIAGLTFVYRVAEEETPENPWASYECSGDAIAFVQVYDADNGDLVSERIAEIDRAAVNVDWGGNVGRLRPKLLDAIQS